MMSKGGITWRFQSYEGTNDGRIAGGGAMQRFAPARVPGFTRYSLPRVGPGQSVVMTALAA